MSILYKFENLADSSSQQFIYCESDEEAQQVAEYLDNLEPRNVLDANDYFRYEIAIDVDADDEAGARTAEEVLPTECEMECEDE